MQHSPENGKHLCQLSARKEVIFTVSSENMVEDT